MSTHPEDFDSLFAALARSRFRSSFRLRQKERDYIKQKGMETIRSHAEDFIRSRLATAMPKNDGKQTPMKGHPVFIAQHATATCCRKCLQKWHKIPLGKAMNEEQIEYAVNVLMKWIDAHK